MTRRAVESVRHVGQNANSAVPATLPATIKKMATGRRVAFVIAFLIQDRHYVRIRTTLPYV
jgi:hypothetical protein